jgi:chitin synthase
MPLVQDLASLSSISDDVTVTCLRERFMTDTIYTSIGSSALVAVNPHKYVASNADSILQKYAADYRDTTENKPRSLPTYSSSRTMPTTT